MNRSIKPLAIGLAALSLLCNTPDALAQSDNDVPERRSLVPDVKSNELPEIDLWYGETQRFGHLGNSQTHINILGSITPKSLVADSWYQFNRGKRTRFHLGPDLHRLAHSGDFNIEIDREQLTNGDNQLVIGVYDLWGRFVSQELTIQYTAGQTWKLPYEVDFSQLDRLQDAVDVMDGHWKLTEDGVRTVEPYYDRQFAFGDSTWTNYELRAEILFHNHLPPALGRKTAGPPYLSHSHTSFAMRWRGFPDDGLAPRRDWQNLGGLIAVRSDRNTPQKGCYWWMHFGRGLPGKQGKRSLVTQEQRYQITPGDRCLYRIRVETTGDHQTRYSAKLWPLGESEPQDWQMVSTDEAESLDSGAVVFVVHHSDVTLCNVKVEAIQPEQ